MNKKQRMANRRVAESLRIPILCPNCGKIGPHFAPPALGDEGFWICTPMINQLIKDFK